MSKMKSVLALFIICAIFTNKIIPFCEANECIDSENGPSNVAYTISVSKSGEGNFTTIQEAIDSIPSDNNRWIRIEVAPGIYAERVQIPHDKSCIILQGHSLLDTTIAFNARDPSSRGGFPTFAVEADNFVAKDITFKNTRNRALNTLGETSKDYLTDIYPAVAAEINGDKACFHRCGFEGFQDTLFDQFGRHYFEDCYIEGAVDFIWGSGQSVYERCTINVTIAFLSANPPPGFITAQGRDKPEDPSGFVFRNCRVFGNGRAFLGRSYRPYSRVIFWESSFADIIMPEGWRAWHGIGHEENFVYAEIQCTGPGANKSKRVPWLKELTSSELSKYTLSSFVNEDGWIDKQPN